MGLREDVQERYPSLVPLLKQPEIANLLTQAIQGNWSPGKFQSQFMASRWFKSQSESMRRWWILLATDPGEAKLQRSSMQQQVQAAATRYGVILNGAQRAYLAEFALQRGFEAGGLEMLNSYRRLLLSGGAKAGPGARRTAARAVQQMARGDYFYGMSTKNAAIWGDRIARGLATVEDAKTAVADQALKMFPQFAQGLQSGQTMAEMTEGMRQTIADELEIDPNTIDLSRGRWSKVLGVRDAKGKLRPMTQFEVQQTARKTDPGRWWRTGHGKQTDSEYTNAVLQMFGKRRGMGLGGGSRSS